MGCCGQKRAELTSRMTSVPARRPIIREARTTDVAIPATGPSHVLQTAAATPAQTTSGVATIALRYVASAPLRLQGAITARGYEFSGERAVQVVAAADAPALLASRLFRRA